LNLLSIVFITVYCTIFLGENNIFITYYICNWCTYYHRGKLL